MDLLALAESIFDDPPDPPLVAPLVAVPVVEAEAAPAEADDHIVDGWKRTIQCGKVTWVKWIDGERKRSRIGPQLPVTNGEAISRARCSKAEKRCREFQNEGLGSCTTLANDIATAARVPKQIRVLFNQPKVRQSFAKSVAQKSKDRYLSDPPTPDKKK